MLSEIAIVEINKLLDLCDAYLLTQAEIDLLNKTGHAPEDVAGYYDSAQTVLEKRSENDTRCNDQLTMLQALAVSDSVDLELQPEKVPQVDIPIFGGSI